MQPGLCTSRCEKTRKRTDEYGKRRLELKNAAPDDSDPSKRGNPEVNAYGARPGPERSWNQAKSQTVAQKTKQSGQIGPHTAIFNNYSRVSNPRKSKNPLEQFLIPKSKIKIKTKNLKFLVEISSFDLKFQGFG